MEEKDAIKVEELEHYLLFPALLIAFIEALEKSFKFYPSFPTVK